VEIVPMTVTVRDRAGRDVSDLRREDFELYANGQAQAISLFERERGPTVLTVVFDSSRSMAADIESARSLVGHLLDLLRPGDLGAILDCSESSRETLTADVDMLRKRLSNVAAGGTTALYDSMLRAGELTSSYLGTAPLGNHQRVMVVVSDGVDTSSTMDLNAALARIRTSGTIVYIVRLNRGTSGTANRIARHLDREYVHALRRIADATGGDLFLDTDSDYSEIRTRIERALSSRYVLAYSPSTPAAPNLHLTVRLKRRELSVLAVRPGKASYPFQASH